MKDVTVLLELTLPRSVTDQQIQSFVETAVKFYLDDRRHQVDPERSEIAWALDNSILGITDCMIDVVGIHDDAVTTGAYPPTGFRALGPRW